MLLRPALEIADRLVNLLPKRLAYALADLAGDAWYRLAPARRGLVAANLARVCEATGRPASGRPLRRMVRSLFRNHARYYLEILRMPHVPLSGVDEVVVVPRWAELEPELRDGARILVSSHLGNPEPFALFLAARGMRPMSPIEEIEPRALFEFLAARRGGAMPELVPLRHSSRPLAERLRSGGLVGIVGDRDLGPGGQPVTIFGHPTTLPTGPAWLAVTFHARLLAGRCLRVAPGRFVADGDLIELPATSDRRAAIAELTRRLAARYEADIAEAPEQWWGSFQPFWPDIADGRAP